MLSDEFSRSVSDIVSRGRYALPEDGSCTRLGAGSFGMAYRFWDLQDGCDVAIKFMKRHDRHLTKYLAMEALNHQQLCHPHVIDFKEVMVTGEHLCIVMEYARHGTLTAFMHARYRQEGKDRLAETDARFIFQQLAPAVHYCHLQGITNRDIKMSNTLLTGSFDWPAVKLSDFGYSKARSQGDPQSSVGTLQYMAPEVLRCGLSVNEADKKYDGFAADTWSCGVVLYVMLVGLGRYPFVADNGLQGDRSIRQNILDKMQNVPCSIPGGVAASDELRDLLGRMLNPDPAKRIKLAEVMGHPWYTCEVGAGLIRDPVRFNEQQVAAQLPSGRQTKEEVQALLSSIYNIYGATTQPLAASSSSKVTAVQGAWPPRGNPTSPCTAVLPAGFAFEGEPSSAGQGGDPEAAFWSLDASELIESECERDRGQHDNMSWASIR